MNRRGFLLGAAALTACSQNKVNPKPVAGHVKRMAITMDDFNLGFDIGVSSALRHRYILEAFDAVDHKAAGFVTGRSVDNPFGKQVVRDWIDQGHSIHNHTWTHSHANKMETETYLEDVKTHRNYLQGVVGAGRYFRFPFLDDGKNRDQQVSLFEGLDNLGLVNAPVTIDSVDWFTNSRLQKALRDNPQTDLVPYRDYYLKMCLTLANYWDGVAQALGFKSLPHLTLMHHNVLNGLFLKDVLLALQADGWEFVEASEALSFELYHVLPPEPTQGRNWLTLKQREAAIEIAPYPREYFKFGATTMDKLGL